MDLEDFKYNYKYKVIIPSIYIMSWIMMFMGPFIIQILYQKICILLLIYLTCKSCMILTISVITYCQSRRVIRKAQQIKE